ncbi:colicin transporter [Bifidobacterium dentium]|uniref:colicin transporter n=1 Tax=Bifidobacterium dentium TaxID=1689 RepID=UPI0018B0CF11|nr:colicin transporter [Bifidobacterium dentium]MBF9690489.1 colicin transporter [Bifidobacterium dentium]
MTGMDKNMTETEGLAAVADQPEATDMAEPEGPHRSRRTVAVVAVVCAAALAVAGGVGYKAWSDHETAVAARDCRSASEAYRKAADSYNGLVDGDAATASRITAKQVKDAATVDGLAEALRASEPKVVACTADTKAGYETKAASIEKSIAWYKSHGRSLKAAVGRVNASKLDKAVDDANQLYKDSDGKVADAKTRDELKRAVAAKDETRIAKAVKAVDDSVEAKRKADEEAARKKAEEEAAAAQAAAEAAAAQAQQSYSGGSYSNAGGSQSYSSNGGGSSSGSTGSSNSGSGSSGSTTDNDWKFDLSKEQFTVNESCASGGFCPIG